MNDIIKMRKMVFAELRKAPVICAYCGGRVILRTDKVEHKSVMVQCQACGHAYLSYESPYDITAIIWLSRATQEQCEYRGHDFVDVGNKQICSRCGVWREN